MSRLIDADILDDEVMHLFISITGNPKQHTVANECKSSFRRMIEEQPTVEAVPKSYAEQIRWERDVAVGQLNEIGCQFGQKMDEVKDKLEALQWIPCSERMPNKDEYLKNDGRFIVTDGNRVYQSIYIYSAHCFRTLVLFDFGSRSNFEVDNCVIAWMPLPEPYKADMRTSAE